MITVNGTFTQSPDEKQYWVLPVSKRLVSGETIITGSIVYLYTLDNWVAIPAEDALVVTPRLVSNDIWFWVSGGVAGKDYYLTARVPTNYSPEGLQHVGTIRVRIRH